MRIDHIFEIKSLDALAEYLQESSPERSWQQLARLFFENVLYRKVTEWNRLVRLCEAMTIVGWGELEPVQAVRTKFLNGFPWTMLVNRFGDKRYVDALWSKRVDGYLMVEDSVVFHGSDDLPAKLSKQGFVATPEAENKPLDAQRNWIVRSPILLGQTVLNCYKSSNGFVKSVAKLEDRLLREMRPEVYGRAIDRLCFYFHLSYLDPGCATNYVIQADDRKLDRAEEQRQLGKLYSADEIKKLRYKLVPRFLFRPFRSIDGQMNISIHLTKEFSQQSTRQQKVEFAQLLSLAIDEVVTRLRKKRLAYDLDAMRADAGRIIQAWALESDAKTAPDRRGKRASVKPK
jgi:hypothetical protein